MASRESILVIRLVVLMLTVLVSLYFAQVISIGLATGYVVLSLTTFIVYAFDKRAARQNRWRVKETTLHTLSLAGGWPGALLARHILRHKTRKQPFRGIFWATLVANVSTVYLVINNANFL